MPSDRRERKRANSRARAAAMAAARKRQATRRRAIVGGGAAVLVVGIIALLVSQSSGGSSKVSTSTSTTAAGSASTSTPPTTVSLAVAPGASITGDTPCPKADGTSPRTTSFAKAPPTCITTGKKYTAVMKTDAGDITIALDPVAAPVTVNNFVVLARYHFFDGIAFHRVIPGFVNQGGDPTGTGTGGPGYKFQDELPKAGSYKVGSIAMANSGANTNGSQFFLIAGPQGVALPPNYSLFGQATGGLDVIDKINKDGDPNPSGSGTPKVVHKIINVTITEA